MGWSKNRMIYMELVQKDLREAFATTEAQDDPEGAVERCGEKIGSYLNSDELMLSDVINQFESKLTSQDVQDRAKACDILHYMFKRIRRDVLKADDLTYIVEFLVDRLRDQHLVIPKVMLCLEPIVKYKHLPVGSCSKILNRIFQEVNVQSHVHRIRRSYFSTLQRILKLKPHLDELLENSPNFMEHFIESFAGEKDPRNLVILFNIVPTVLKNFEVKPLEEDLFESLACYFPIDFNPISRANSLETITREDLASRLQFCLSRTNLFSKFLVPLALEKLSADLVNAKLDSLALLKMCCDECYGPEDLGPFLKQIWHALRREIFLESNQHVEESCISFICSAFKVLAKDADLLKQSFDMMFSECKHHLSEPELRMSVPASKVLLAVASSNEVSCSASFGLIVSLLHQQFLENGINSNRKAILGILKKFIAILAAYPSLSLGSLLKNWDEIVGSWFTLLSHSDPEFVVLALHLFLQIFDNKIAHSKNKEKVESESESEDPNAKYGLDLSYRNLLQEHLFALINKPDVAHDLATCVILVMERFATNYPDEVETLLVPKLLTEFDNNNAPPGQEIELNPFILKATSECSAVPTLARVILPKLIDLSTAQVAALEKDKEFPTDSRTVQIIRCLLEAIDKICCENLNPKDSSLSLVIESMDKFIESGTYFAALGNREAYLALAEIITKVMRAVDQSTQQKIMDTLWNQKQKCDGVDPIQVLEATPILLLEALLAPLHPKIKVENKMQLIDALLDKTTSNQVSESDPEGYARLFAVLHNKLDNWDFQNLLLRIGDLVDGIILEGKKEVEGASEDEAAEKPAILDILIWTTKTLAMKGSLQLVNWIDKLIDLLGTGKYGPRAAEGFSKILSSSGSNSTLVAENHCTFKFLHKQKFFLKSVPKLIAAYRKCSASANAKHKMNYIKALSCQLKFVPKSVMHAQLENVIPLLIAGLSIAETSEVSESDQLVVLSSLNAILELFTAQGQGQDTSTTPSTSSSAAAAASDESSGSSLVQYFRDLAPRLLELATFNQNMEIRIVALKCLQRCAKFPTHVIVPLKNKIVTELSKSLDDPKRLVRKEAVLTSNIWILSGAPGGI